MSDCLEDDSTAPAFSTHLYRPAIHIAPHEGIEERTLRRYDDGPALVIAASPSAGSGQPVEEMICHYRSGSASVNMKREVNFLCGVISQIRRCAPQIPWYLCKNFAITQLIHNREAVPGSVA